MRSLLEPNVWVKSHTSVVRTSIEVFAIEFLTLIAHRVHREYLRGVLYLEPYFTGHIAIFRGNEPLVVPVRPLVFVTRDTVSRTNSVVMSMPPHNISVAHSDRRANYNFFHRVRG